MREIEKNKVYRHYKGNHYYVMNLADHTETNETLVIYQALYGEGDVYARPLEMFLEEIPEKDWKKNVTGQTYRFELAKEVQKEFNR